MLTPTEMMSYVCSQPGHPKLALLGSSSNATLPFYSGVEGKQAFEQPVANILHEINNLKQAKAYTMYLSYPPSELELGMLWRAKVTKVYFAKNLDPLDIGEYTVTQDGCEKLASSILEVSFLDEEAKRNLEKKEVRLNAAMQNPIAERRMNVELTAALRRGLNDAQALNIEDDRSKTKIDEDFIRIVLSLVDRSWNSKDGMIKPLDRVAGNNIGAIMVDKDNKIIGWGLNYKGNNKTLHAETMMIQHYLRENDTGKLPEGAKIYTSLQCCHMCAGHIATLGENIEVIYAQRDPFFNGESAISEGVALNNCKESPTTLPIHEIFASQVGQQEILDFLFGLHPDTVHYPEKTTSTRELFARTLRDVDLFRELSAVVQKHNAVLEQSALASPTTTVSSLMSSDSEEDLESLSIATDTIFEEDDSITSSGNCSSVSIIEAGEMFLDALGDIAPSTPPRSYDSSDFKKRYHMDINDESDTSSLSSDEPVIRREP